MLQSGYFRAKWIMDILPFYPRDAMLLVLAIALCPSVCQTITSRNSIETDDRIELVLHGRFLRPIQQCVVRKFGYLQK